MIYIEEKSFESQLKILELFSESNEFDIVLWLYPEMKIDTFCGLKIYHEKNFLDKPVTTYGVEVNTPRTERFEFGVPWIKFLYESRDLIKESCDSCVLYKKNDLEWFCCTIGHEGMCLVSEDSQIYKIRKNNFLASLDPPVWW